MIGAHHHAKNSHKDRKEWRLVTVQEGMNLVSCSKGQQNCWTEMSENREGRRNVFHKE